MMILNGDKQQNRDDSYPYDSQRILQVVSDPIKLGILIEVIRNPDITTFEIKKKLQISGSKIYYYINQLIDNNIIVESATEQLTNHMARRKFKISQWVIDSTSNIKYDPKRGHRKAFHIFQLHFAIALLNQQIRLLEKIPEKDFDKSLSERDLPHEQLFFVTKEMLPNLKNKYNEINKKMKHNQKKPHSFLKTVKNSSHVLISGIYPLE